MKPEGQRCFRSGDGRQCSPSTRGHMIPIARWSAWTRPQSNSLRRRGGGFTDEPEKQVALRWLGDEAKCGFSGRNKRTTIMLWIFFALITVVIRAALRTGVCFLSAKSSNPPSPSAPRRPPTSLRTQSRQPRGHQSHSIGQRGRDVTTPGIRDAQRDTPQRPGEPTIEGAHTVTDIATIRPTRAVVLLVPAAASTKSVVQCLPRLAANLRLTVGFRAACRSRALVALFAAWTSRLIIWRFGRPQ